MLETSKKLTETANEIIEVATKQFTDLDTIMNMGADELKFVQLIIKYVNESSEYITRTAEMMTAIDGKLDKLLSKN